VASPAPHNPSRMDAPPASPARAAVEVIAVTTSDDFLLELGHALGGQAAVTPVESLTLALAQLGQAKRTQIIALDSRGIADLSAQIESFQAQTVDAPVLVFAEESEEQEVAAALKGTPIFAVLPVPVDAHKTAALLQGAVADSKSKPPGRKPQTTPAIVIEQVLPAAPELIRPQPRDSGASRINGRLIGGIALAIVAAVALWFITRGKQTAIPAQTPVAPQSSGPTTEPAAPAIETSLVKGKVDELLEKAREAMRERRYTEPSGDNALLYYRSAAYADPASGEASDGLTRVGAVLAKRFQEAMTAAKYEDAAVALAQFKSARPDDARLTQFQTDLGKARAEALRAQQEEARQKRLAAEQAARDAAVAEQRKARDARAAAAAEAERQAQLARQKEAEDKLKAEQVAKAAQEAARSSAPQAASSANATLQSSLKRKRYVAPEYPREQLEKNIGGVVTVAFTVTVKGETQNVRIESATPAKLFDEAALAAVKRWRYEPLVIDGVATEVPMRMAIRFAPPQ